MYIKGSDVMTDRVKPLWNVEKKTTSSNTDEVLVVEGEEIKKIGINDLINNNSNITEMENKIETNRSNIEKQSTLIVGNQIGIEKHNKDIEDINNNINTINSDIETIKNKKHNLNNLLKEARHFSTSVWINSDETNCVLQNETYKDMTYYKCTKAYTSFRQNVSLKANTTYTFSYYVKGSRAGLDTRAFWSNLEGNNPSGQSLNGDAVKLDDTNWKRVVNVINVVEDFVGYFRVEPFGLEDGDYIYVCGLCLLEGNCFDTGFIENPEDQNWKYLSSGTDIVLQPDGKYCGTNLYHHPPTLYTDVAFYYTITSYGRNANYRKIHAWNTNYNIEYVATMNNNNWSNWSVVHKEDEVYNFNLTSVASTGDISTPSIYCNNNIEIDFISNGVISGSTDTNAPSCALYIGYKDNGTAKNTRINFSTPVNASNTSKAPLRFKVTLIKMNNNCWLLNLDAMKRGGYDTYYACTYITGTNIEITGFSFTSNNKDKKFENPCLIVRYN